ncbi:MAG TPA: helix-hairpin-helix domain-containing protein, partial [Polyangiaceae bacterium]|nr:helix-hairpin-helix domain-containing protein [Polyangiaceae bacterium]
MTHWGPEPPEGVRKYVERMGHGHGVGYGYSKRLIEFFGHEKLPAIIKNEPHRLAHAINRSNFDWQGLSEKWRSKTDEEHTAMMAILSYRNIGYAEASRICKCYGFQRGVAVVQEDPYQLSFDVDGIGFERADRIAAEAGTGKGSSKRARAALFHALNKATEDGDTYVSHKDWVSKAEWLMGRSHGG